MTPHLLDLEKFVPPEGNLCVLVIPFYTITPLYRYNIPLYQLYRYTLPNYTVLGCLTYKRSQTMYNFEKGRGLLH
jgi:hypothetical protein